MNYKTIGEAVEAAKKEYESSGKKWTKEIELQVRRAHVQQLRDEELLGPKTEEKQEGGILFDDDVINLVVIILGVLFVGFIINVIIYR